MKTLLVALVLAQLGSPHPEQQIQIWTTPGGTQIYQYPTDRVEIYSPGRAPEVLEPVVPKVHHHPNPYQPPKPTYFWGD